MNLEHMAEEAMQPREGAKPHLFWFNIILTVTLIVGLLTEKMPMATWFIIGFGIAVTVNYPKYKRANETVEKLFK